MLVFKIRFKTLTDKILKSYLQTYQLFYIFKSRMCLFFLHKAINKFLKLKSNYTAAFEFQIAILPIKIATRPL